MMKMGKLIQNQQAKMKTKKIIYILSLLIVFNSFSQQKKTKYFFEDVSILKLPIIIDEVSVENLYMYKEVSYKTIKDLLISKNEDFAIKMDDSDSNSKFYIAGKYNFHDKVAVIMFNKTEKNSNNLINCFLLMYESDGKLSSFRTIGWFGNHTGFKISLINLNVMFEFEADAVLKKYNINYLTYYPLSKEKGYFPFSDNNCEEMETCLNYKPNLDSIPDRKIKKYIFDKAFFEKEKRLIPLKYCSKDTISQILSSISNEKKISMKNYFIDSKKIEDGKRVVFFLNEYEYKNYRKVSEVGYQIFNKNGTLSKREQIAQYYITKEGITSALLSKVFIENDNLIVESQGRGFEKKVDIFKLADSSKM
jgi:hypothetical protein